MKIFYTLFLSILISFKLSAGGCTPPSVVGQPSNVVICENDNTFFQIVATGPSLVYQWQIDQGSGFVDLSNVAPYSGVTTDILTITSAPFSIDNALFRCIVSNGCVPNDTSLIAQLKINVSPSISLHPSNILACETANTSFNVGASGSGLAYQWQVDEGAGFINVPAGLPYSGHTTASLSINGVSTVMNGYIYQCLISGFCAPSIVSSSATLNVDSLPVILTQPTFAETCENNDASFSITAAGPGLTYQWQENQGSGFVNIIGSSTYFGVNSNILIISGATLTMNGYLYQCIVSGNCLPSDTTTSIPFFVYPVYSVFTNATICQGDTLQFGASDLTAPGFYSNTLSTINSCDSVIYLSLNVLPSFFTTESSTICSGDSILIGSTFQTTPGVYTYTLTATNGCDSVIENTLDVNPIYNFVDSTVICLGDSALIFGSYEMIDSIYTQNFSTFSACDSIYSHHLIVKPSYAISLNQNICSGDSILLGGAYQTTGGSYIDTYTSMNGCDSTVTSLLTVHPLVSTSQSITICSDDSVFLAGAYQHYTGTYVDYLSSVFSCDSVVTTNLLVHDVPVIFYDQSVTTCDTNAAFLLSGGFPFGGVYSGPGVSSGVFYPSIAGAGTHAIIYSYTNSYGCSNSASSNFTVTACAGMNEYDVLSGFVIYPNPFNEFLTIELLTYESSDITIFNVLGEVVHSQKINKGKTEINLTEISAGIYFIQNTVGDKMSTTKLVKK